MTARAGAVDGLRARAGIGPCRAPDSEPRAAFWFKSITGHSLKNTPWGSNDSTLRNVLKQTQRSGREGWPLSPGRW